MDKLSTWIWCDRNALEKAEFYTGILKNSKIIEVTTSPADYPSGKIGDVLLVEAELLGHSVCFLNGGGDMDFNESISLMIECEDQDEIDYYWDALSHDKSYEQCGWVKDKYGMRWQIAPKLLNDLIADQDKEKAKRVMLKMMEMKKIDMSEIEKAAA